MQRGKLRCLKCREGNYGVLTMPAIISVLLTALKLLRCICLCRGTQVRFLNPAQGAHHQDRPHRTMLLSRPCHGSTLNQPLWLDTGDSTCLSNTACISRCARIDLPKPKLTIGLGHVGAAINIASAVDTARVSVSRIPYPHAQAHGVR